MKTNFQKAVDFAEKAKHLKGITSIILFGSVARGEDTAASDIDIAIILEKDDKAAITKEISKIKDEKIQVTFVEKKNLPDETELTGAFSGDGIILYGHPIIIKADNLSLNPKMIISYSLNHLSQAEKVKLSRALYGSTSKSTVNNKTYTTVTKGAVNEPGIDKISKSVLMVERNKAAKVIELLKHFNAEFKQIPLWTY